MISCHILTWAWGVRLNLYHDHLWVLPALPLRCREVDASHGGEGFCVEEKPAPLHLGPHGSSCIDLFPVFPLIACSRAFHLDLLHRVVSFLEKSEGPRHRYLS